MNQSGTRREIPGWVAAVVVGVVVIILVIFGARMFRGEEPTANKVTVIGPSNSSYISHYGTPPPGQSTNANQSASGSR